LRAKQVIEAVLAARGVSATIHVFDHGEQVGDAVQQRSVVVTRTSPTPPEPEQPENRCGPDATSWFIRQVTAAKSDADVLAVQNQIRSAERVLRPFGFSVDRIIEGGVARKVLDAESRAGSPTRTPEARSQLSSAAPGRAELTRAIATAAAGVIGGSTARAAAIALALSLIRSAALGWKALVGTGRKYDFKNRSETLQNPATEHCPDNCASTITLCPSTGVDCYIKDVPGNLFYAHVGRFTGWTELTLQLGSQFAQLDASARWDPPEDTRMITFGFNLPGSLSQSALCSAMNANRSIFDMRECANCAEEVQAQVV
jgi:hypothetical protein